MKTFAEWLKENYNEDLPTGSVNGTWFAERGLPMVVRCACCYTTMALPSAMVDEDGGTLCSSCAESVVD